MNTSSNEPPRKKAKFETVSDEDSPCAVASDSTLMVRSDGKKKVKKGSLKLSTLHEEAQKAAALTYMGNSTEEDMKHARRTANRLSAFQSRQRRKQIIEDLRKTVADLSGVNAEQRSSINTLKAKLENAEKETEMLQSEVIRMSTMTPATTQGPLSNVQPAPSAQLNNRVVLELLKMITMIGIGQQETKQCHALDFSLLVQLLLKNNR